MKIPDAPFFADPVQEEPSGVDFLNLGAVGERLIAAALPGITNATRYLRAYSMAAWTAWQFNENLKAISAKGQKLPMNERRLWRQYREKVEVLFSWCNRRYPACIGNTRQYPETSTKVELSFDEPEFGPHNAASWFAAAAYGPSFSDRNGLGFLSEHRNVRIPTQLGEQVALVINSMMSEVPSTHSRIASFSEFQGSARDVKALERAFDLRKATKREKDLFRQALYPVELVGEWDTAHGNRATSLSLMLRILKKRGASMNAEDVRRAMALGRLQSGAIVDDEQHARIRTVWHVLSIRQLQRIALEKLLSWFESTLQQHRYSLCDWGIVLQRLRKELRAGDEEFASCNVQEWRAKLARRVERAGGVRSAPIEREELNQFELRGQLERVGRGGGEVLPLALRALFVCSDFAERLASDEHAAPLCAMGGRERVSLAYLVKFISSRDALTVQAFAEDVVMQLVYAQHLRTAAARVEPGKNKFRFSMEETGLRPLVGKINAQEGTPDRIRHALLLMAECGMVSVDAEERFSV
jgi:hypothetical protein